MIGLISCVKSKSSHICEAKDMYISSLFKYMYIYAKHRCKEVYILSAKYGLLSENTVISPYNKTLNNMTENQKKEWGEKVMNQLRKRFDINNTSFLLLGGQNYIKYLDLPHKKEPLKGLSMGYRLQFLKRNK